MTGQRQRTAWIPSWSSGCDTYCYRVFQRYRCKHCDHTFNDQTGTVFEHSAVSLHRGVSKDKLTPYIRAFQLRQRIHRKPGNEALKAIRKTAL